MKRVQRLLVLENQALSADVFVLSLGSEEALPEILPGQFVNVLVEGSTTTFLRRPLSVHDVDLPNRILKLFVQKVGDGTRQLSRLHKGDSLDVLYPLGRGFDYVPAAGHKPLKYLLVGGGCGIAPLLYLAKMLSKESVDVHILLGGRSKAQIVALESYVKYGKLHLVTEDGSLGEKGRVTDHSVLREPFDKVFCCGPKAMMQAVAHWSSEKNIPCQVSLENTMACGVGACLCCVTPSVTGHRCVCTEGPVFDIEELGWK